MSSTLNSKNHDDTPSGMHHSCHLFEKFLVRYPGSQKDTINLIIGEKLDRNRLFSKFMDKLNIYENFAINLLPSNIESTPSCIELDNVSFIISSEKESNPYKKISPDGIIITSKSESNLRSIAYQRHLSKANNIDSLSLSEFRSAPMKVDAAIRTASCLFFDINSIRVQDSYSKRSGITGLDIYEACQIARNAGMSEKLQLIYLIVDDSDLHTNTEDLISLLFWYFLEGRMHREIDHNADNLTTYIIQSVLYEEPIKFQKSIVTDRWTVVNPLNGEKIPCTELDYEMMKKGEIPDVLLSVSTIE